ncbi:MAG: hypothetical protein ABEI31_02230 [Halodesulfurarchaeum sp.]
MTGRWAWSGVAVEEVRAVLTRRDGLVAGWMLATVLAFYGNFLFVHSTGLSFVFAVGSFGVGLALARVDPLLRELLALGTIGGFVELLGDYFLVEIAGTLSYPAGYPQLLRSPAYMPVAWAVLIAFLGYVSVRVGEEFGARAAVLAPAVVALVSESGFESLASRGGGWVYTVAPLGWIGHAPLFIVVAEGLMFATVAYWVRRGPLVGGLGMGTTIVASYVGVFYLFGLLGSVV